MSIDHHVRASKERDKRRFLVDIILVVVLLVAILGVFVVHRLRQGDIKESRLLSDARLEVERDRSESARVQRVMLEQQSKTERASETKQTSDTAPISTDEEKKGEDGALASSSPSFATTSVLQNETPISHVRFEDVTVTRYDSARLGFVMELPTGWSRAYEGGESIAFANFVYDLGISDADMMKKPDAMWMRVVRPCTSMEATSTIFQFTRTSEVNIREARACVPPFGITVGYRTDSTDWSGRERFLLSIARTLYPMVKSQPPYESIR